MLNGILVQNFKAFHDEAHWIPLKPVTLLLGRNSSGKSSMLQAMLVCSQSWKNSVLNLRRILFSGRLTDVGSFHNVFHRDAENVADLEVAPGQVVVRFGFHLKVGDEHWVQCVLAYGPANGDIYSTAGELSTITLYPALTGTPAWQSRSGGLTFRVQASSENPIDWSLRLENEFLSAEELSRRGAFLFRPGRHEDADSPELRVGTTPIAQPKPDADDPGEGLEDTPYEENLENEDNPTPGSEQKYATPSRYELDVERIEGLVFSFDRLSGLIFDEAATRERQDAAFKHHFNGFEAPDDIERLSATELAATDELAKGLASQLQRIFARLVGELDQLSYLGPLRHRGHRIYSIRTPANVWRVGPSGEQMIDLLYHDRDVLVETNALLEQGLGARYVVDVERDASITTVACELVLKDDKRALEGKVGLLDVGTGIAQVLPVVVQCAKYKQPAFRGFSLLVEQPELHLHPQYQHRLARMFANVATFGSQVIAETHSEHLVLGLGNVIAEDFRGRPSDNEDGKTKQPFSATQAVVLVFTRKHPTSEHGKQMADRLFVEQIGFRDDGDFRDRFPGGFFPERQELLRRRIRGG